MGWSVGFPAVMTVGHSLPLLVLHRPHPGFCPVGRSRHPRMHLFLQYFWGKGKLGLCWLWRVNLGGHVRMQGLRLQCRKAGLLVLAFLSAVAFGQLWAT